MKPETLKPDRPVAIAQTQGGSRLLVLLTYGTRFKFRCNFHGINLRRYICYLLQYCIIYVCVLTLNFNE